MNHAISLSMGATVADTVADTIVESFELWVRNCSSPEALAESFLSSVKDHIEVTTDEWKQIVNEIREVVQRRNEERAPVGSKLDCLA